MNSVIRHRIERSLPSTLCEIFSENSIGYIPRNLRNVWDIEILAIQTLILVGDRPRARMADNLLKRVKVWQSPTAHHVQALQTPELFFFAGAINSRPPLTRL